MHEIIFTTFAYKIFICIFVNGKPRKDGYGVLKINVLFKNFKAMGKFNSLFSENQIFNRKHADQRKFETSFREEIPEFITAIQNSFERMKMVRSEIEPYGRDRNLNAVLMSGFLRSELHKSFGSKIRIDHTGRYYYSKDREWIIYFKKLNTRTYLPDNIETKHVAGLHRQLAFDLAERSPVIYIGYTVTKSWDYLTGFHAVYSRDSNIIWRSSLDDLNISSVETPKITIPDIGISSKDTGIQIRRRTS